MVKLGEVGPDIWEVINSEIEKTFPELSFTVDWRKLAHERKLSRELHEKFGSWEGIVLDPRFQMVKHYLQENVDAETIVGEPFLPWTTIIIILYMLNKRVSSNLLVFITVLFFNVNPFYVALMVFLMIAQKFLAKKNLKFHRESSLRTARNIKESACDLAKSDVNFDHVLIGSNIATLYTAALLARCGHRCCVLQPVEVDPIEIQSSEVPLPVNLYQGIVCKPEKYQMLLDVVQPIIGQSRVKLMPVGSESNGFTASILASDDSSKSGLFHCIRPGEDVFNIVVCEESILTALFSKARLAMENISMYLLTRVRNFPIQTLPQVEELVEKDISLLFRSHGLFDEAAMDLLGALCCVSAEEMLPIEQLSASSFGLLINAVNTGKFHIFGGTGKLIEALTSTICSSGGSVVQNIRVKNMEFLEHQGNSTLKATGVSVITEDGSLTYLHAHKSVVSGVGLLSTYLSLIPRQALSDSTIAKLSNLTEAKPHVKVVFWLNGTADELSFQSTDYFERSSKKSQSCLLSSQFLHIWSPSCQSIECSKGPIQTIVIDFEVPDNLVCLEVYRGFNMADDAESFDRGPKLYMCPRDVSSNPNDPGFGQSIGRPVRITPRKKDQLLKKAETILGRVYPKTRGRILKAHLAVPTLGGRKLSETPEKYRVRMGAATDVDNLFITGQDIALSGLMGELQSGWATANTILGYTPQELQDGINVVADLQKLL